MTAKGEATTFGAALASARAGSTGALIGRPATPVPEVPFGVPTLLCSGGISDERSVSSRCRAEASAARRLVCQRGHLRSVILTFGERAAYLQQLLNGVQAQEVTYAEVGQTCQQALPPGYRHQRRQAVVGHGPEAWARAREALATWQAHRHLGLGIYPADAPVTPGAVVLAIARVGPARLVLPCRVVYRTDEPRSFGFAYGTLPPATRSVVKSPSMSRGRTRA